jgi:cyclohexanone monooxygenase
VFEAGDGVGGTWYWNRYPGARCDSESIYYSFSDCLSEDLLHEWSWSERYAAQPEILNYLNHVADRLDLRRDIQFNTRIGSAVFDEAVGRWQITTDDGAQVTATYFITAVGCLSAENIPPFVGVDTFQGGWYHTGRWPHEGVDFTGKRVAVIGTGATAVQVIPEVANEAAQVYVFQRTANYDLAGQNRPLDPADVREVRANYKDIWQNARESGFGFPYGVLDRSALAVSPEERQRIYEEGWAVGGFHFLFDTFTDLLFDKEANDTAAEFVRAKIRARVHDADVAELLAPKDHPISTKRPPLEHGYYEAFNRDNVTLVDVRRAPIQAITEHGVRTADREYEVDSIIFATGFDAMTGSLTRIDIRGRGGLSLTEKWADGPRTYLGVATHGFPNMFMITGPQSPSVLSNMPVSIEQHGDWIADCLAYLRAHDLDRIEPTEEAEDGWVAHVADVAAMTLLPLADSWWVGANIPGKPRQLYPYIGGVGPYRAHCADIAAKGYEGFALAGAGVAAG